MRLIESVELQKLLDEGEVELARLAALVLGLQVPLQQVEISVLRLTHT